MHRLDYFWPLLQKCGTRITLVQGDVDFATGIVSSPGFSSTNTSLSYYQYQLLLAKRLNLVEESVCNNAVRRTQLLEVVEMRNAYGLRQPVRNARVVL